MATTDELPKTPSKSKLIIQIVAVLAVILIALLIASPLWVAKQQRQERIETEWTATLFLDVYLRDQVVPPLLFAPGFQSATAESRLITMEKQYGKPLRSYHILESHSGGEQSMDLYYVVAFQKADEPIHIHLVRQSEDWKIADIVWRSPA